MIRAQLTPPQCNGPGCSSEALIKAHIMPAGFARGMHRPGGYNVGLSNDGAHRARYQLGKFDKTILCGDCDRILGKLDDFALFFSRSVLPPTAIGQVGSIPEVDCDKLVAFATSVIWRASLSTDPSFAEISLGPLSDRARDISFGAAAQAFPVIVNRLASPDYDVSAFYVEPIRRKLGDNNTYTFHIGGFQWFVLADSRPVPLRLRQLVINGSSELRSLGVPLERTTEFLGMRQIADRVRRVQVTDRTTHRE